MVKRGVEYRPNHPVTSIEGGREGFLVKGDWGQLTAGKVVLAAGVGNAKLAPISTRCIGPRLNFLIPANEPTPVCRCEEITAGCAFALR